MSTPAQNPTPKPELIFDILNAYQRTSALKGAIELDVFTGIGEGADTAESLAKRSKADARSMRILCDYLVILGFLTKSENRYSLSPDSAAYLDRRSPVCMASVAGFLANSELIDKYKNIAEIVRRGGALDEDKHTGGPNNPVSIISIRPRSKNLRKVHQALVPGGRAVTVEFIPNEDRVSPPLVAAFAMVMLGVTRSGDAYPFSEYDRMFRNAGFSSNERRFLPTGPQSVIVSTI